jgi:hypothetical protein
MVLGTSTTEGEELCYGPVTVRRRSGTGKDWYGVVPGQTSTDTWMPGASRPITTKRGNLVSAITALSGERSPVITVSSTNHYVYKPVSTSCHVSYLTNVIIFIIGSYYLALIEYYCSYTILSTKLSKPHSLSTALLRVSLSHNTLVTTLVTLLY